MLKMLLRGKFNVEFHRKGEVFARPFENDLSIVKRHECINC